MEQHCEQKETLYRRLCLGQGTAFVVPLGATWLLDALAASGNVRNFAAVSGRAGLNSFVGHLQRDLFEFGLVASRKKEVLVALGVEVREG